MIKTVIILQIGNTTFIVNGISNTLHCPPCYSVIRNSRTLVPIRAIIESLGRKLVAMQQKGRLKNLLTAQWIGIQIQKQ